MSKICFYFQIHQPSRIKPFRIFDIGEDDSYFDENKDCEIFQRVSQNSYLPMNKLLLKLINSNKDKFKVTFSISGIALEQMEKYSPETLKSFQDLAKTGQVEFLSETYYHSLSSIFSKSEFKRQVEMHKSKIENLFGVTPQVFRNTELVYSNDIAEFVESMGYFGILAEGWHTALGFRSPNYLYEPSTTSGEISLFLKNYKLSDDIAFRFSNTNWDEYPLTPNKYLNWISREEGEIVNLFMDYETFGEHQRKESGIFDFFENFVNLSIKDKISFVTPSDILQEHTKKEKIDVPYLLSWADTNRDLSAWLGNKMQSQASSEIYELESMVKELDDPKILENWRKLTTSDHFYYMCTKVEEDGNVHGYFSCHEAPYDSYVYFMNCLNDLIIRIKLANQEKKLRLEKQINDKEFDLNKKPKVSLNDLKSAVLD